MKAIAIFYMFAITIPFYETRFDEVGSATAYDIGVWLSEDGGNNVFGNSFKLKSVGETSGDYSAINSDDDEMV